jgi:hypothetical protein
MPSCRHCGHDADQESRFCKHCGAALGDASAQPAASSPPEAEARARPAQAEAGADADDDTLILRLFDERPEEALARRARLWLLDPEGEHVARACELQDEITLIGRQPDCTVSLPSSTVSRRHAQIRQEGSRFFLRDLSSTNGTLLNREPVIGEELLHDRDEIGVGIYRLIFRYS